MKYRHECTGCGYVWLDRSRYYSCPWCGEPCTNELAEDETFEEMLEEYGAARVEHVTLGREAVRLVPVDEAQRAYERVINARDRITAKFGVPTSWRIK